MSKITNLLNLTKNYYSKHKYELILIGIFNIIMLGCFGIIVYLWYNILI